MRTIHPAIAPSSKKMARWRTSSTHTDVVVISFVCCHGFGYACVAKEWLHWHHKPNHLVSTWKATKKKLKQKHHTLFAWLGSLSCWSQKRRVMRLTKGAAENTKHVARNPKVKAKRKQHQDKYQSSSKNVREVVKKYEHCSKRSTSTAANIMKVSTVISR